MRVTVTLDLHPDDLGEAYPDGVDFDDLEAAFAARLEEVYCGKYDHPVRGRAAILTGVTR